MKFTTFNHRKYILEFAYDLQDWGVGLSAAKSIVTNGKFYIYFQVLCFVVRIEFY